jgi:hypothetical protein
VDICKFDRDLVRHNMVYDGLFSSGNIAPISNPKLQRRGGRPGVSFPWPCRSCPTRPLSSFHAHRQLHGWIPPPQVIYAVSAHC